MSDLTDELLHMAADGANQARPLPVADVIRRGKRRRARAIGQRSLSGLSVLGIGAAVVMTGVLHPVHGAAGHPASSSANTGTTLTETTRSSAGTMNVQIKYRDEARGEIQPLSIIFAGKSKAVKKHGFITVAFGPVVSLGPAQGPGCPPKGKSGAVALGVRVNKNGSFAGSLSRPLIATITRDGNLCGNEIMRVSLMKNAGPGSNIMTAALILTR